MNARLRFLPPMIIALLAFPLIAADETQNLLEAKRVDDYLQFQIRKVKDGVAVEYRADPTNGGFKTLIDGKTFAVPDEIDLGYYKFNPFKVSVISTETAADDPNAKAVAEFVSALAKTAKAFAPLPQTGGSASDLPPLRNTQGQPFTAESCKADCGRTAGEAAAAATTQVLAATPCNQKKKAARNTCIANRDMAMKQAFDDAFTAAFRACTSKQDMCNTCLEFTTAAAALHKAVLDLGAPPGTKDLRGWVDAAVGRDGIREVKNLIVDSAKNMDSQIEAAAEVRKTLTELTITARTLKCDIVDFDKLVEQVRTDAGTLDELLARHRTIRDSMTGLITSLAAYDLSEWRGDPNDPEDLIFRKSTSDSDKTKTIGLTFRLTTYTFDDKNTIFTSAAAGEATRSVILRQFRSFVPEVGVAVVYNELEYPKYSVKDGKVASETDKTNVNAALTLNFLTNPLGGRFAYPGFQLGVSKIDDYPGILGGAVIRFARPEKFSIGIGGLLTWYKELNGIAVGDAIESKEKLDEKLRRRTKNGWYVAVQYTF